MDVRVDGSQGGKRSLERMVPAVRPRALGSTMAHAWRLGIGSRYFRIWPATGLLFALSPVIASGSLSSSALLSMLPFASVVAIAAVGQTLIVVQGGLDLSVPGMITLATILVTQYPHGDPGRLPVAMLLAITACAVAGLVSGIAVTQLAITPIVATLGVNALLFGVVLYRTNGNAPGTVVDGLSGFAVAKNIGVPNTVWVAAAIITGVGICMKKTVVGRRFMLIGENTRAATAAAIPIVRYRVTGYIGAGVAYGLAGVLLAGFLQSPGLSAGNEYLFPTIVAVVLGGTPLSGGHGSVVGTAAGALFLTQLQQVVFGAGAKPSSQYLIQGFIIAIGMAVSGLPLARLMVSRTSVIDKFRKEEARQDQTMLPIPADEYGDE